MNFKCQTLSAHFCVKLAGIQGQTMASDTSKRSSYFLITPMAAIFAVFLVIPLVTIVIVSFWDYDEYRILPDFILENL